jgi:alkylhydroperoxidase/carboxymuconolactone decarboxylase family protein YurZ
MRAAPASVRCEAMAGPGQELLRRLAVNDDSSVRTVLVLRPELAAGGTPFGVALSPRIRTLVRLAALVALDASTASLRWAVELASCAGAGDDEIVAVLAAVAPEVGLPVVVSAAPRLALAIGQDIEVDEPGDG